MSTQQEINEGQRNINGALCYVDWHILEALEALINALSRRNVLSRQELEQINEEFQKAYETSPKVAEIDPPGCGTNFFRSVSRAA